MNQQSLEQNIENTISFTNLRGEIMKRKTTKKGTINISDHK